MAELRLLVSKSRVQVVQRAGQSPVARQSVGKTRRAAIVLLRLFEIAFLRRSAFSVEALVAAETREECVRNEAMIGVGMVDFDFISVALTGFHLRKHVVGCICLHLGLLRIEGAVDQQVQEERYTDVDFLVFLRSAVDRPDRVYHITRR